MHLFHYSTHLNTIQNYGHGVKTTLQYEKNRKNIKNLKIKPYYDNTGLMIATFGSLMFAIDTVLYLYLDHTPDDKVWFGRVRYIYIMFDCLYLDHAGSPDDQI